MRLAGGPGAGELGDWAKKNPRLVRPGAGRGLGGVNSAAAMAGGETGVDILLSGTAGPAAIVASELDHTGVLLLAA